MKFRILFFTTVMMPLACHRHKDENPQVETVPGPAPAPGIVLGLQGQPIAASVVWKLPDYLQGRFQDTGKPFVEASFDSDLTQGEEKRSAHFNSGFSVKSCDPVAEVASFLALLDKEPLPNLPEALQTDSEIIESWKGDSRNFKGKILLKKTYKSGPETGIYRFDAVLANEITKECLFWNLVITPGGSVSAEFIESSTEYQALQGSLATTWKGIGALFAD